MIKIDSYKKGIVSSTILNILAKLIAFLNTLVITYYFGTQSESDIYFYIISVTALICNTINGIDLLVIVPEILRLKGQETEEKAQQFVNFFFYLYIVIGFIFSILIFIEPVSFYTIFSKFDTEKIQKYLIVIKLSSGIIIFQLINGLLTSALTSYKFFTAPIIAVLINSIFSISSTLLLHESLGIKGAVIGILLGYCVNFLLLITTMRSKLKWNFFNIILLKDKLVWKNIGLMQLNILPVWFRSYITITLLSNMATGTITALNIAQNIALIPEVFITSQILAVVGIKFSELSAIRAFSDLRTLLVNVLTGLLLIIVPIAIVFFICSKDIVSILYLRGNFDSQSLNLTTFCLLYLSILLPFKIPDSLFTRLFTSLQLYKPTVLSGLLAHTIIALLTYFLTTKFGLAGYFTALLLGYCLIMPIVFFSILYFKVPTLKSFTLLKNLFFIAILSLIISTIVHYIYLGMNFSPFINIAGVTFIVAIPFWICSYFFLDIPPIKDYLHQFSSKIKKIKFL